MIEKRALSARQVVPPCFTLAWQWPCRLERGVQFRLVRNPPRPVGPNKAERIPLGRGLGCFARMGVHELRSLFDGPPRQTSDLFEALSYGAADKPLHLCGNNVWQS